jgi:glyoxylase-like metal-dependent hydrolase (beta-lactamase superfamily II)
MKGGSAPAHPSTDEIVLFSLNVGEPSSPFFENAYLVIDPRSKGAILIDPGCPDDRIDDYLFRNGLKLQAILNTHGHLDHTSGNDYYARKFGVKSYAHHQDRPMILSTPTVMIFLTKAGHLNLGGMDLQVLHTPGHTPGSVAYLIHGVLFTGDTLFRGDIGSAWGSTKPEQDLCLQQEIQSIVSALLPLPASTPVYPGHGDKTTLGEERNSNPWLKAGAFSSASPPRKEPKTP